MYAGMCVMEVTKLGAAGGKQNKPPCLLLPSALARGIEPCMNLGLSFYVCMYVCPSHMGMQLFLMPVHRTHAHIISEYDVPYHFIATYVCGTRPHWSCKDGK